MGGCLLFLNPEIRLPGPCAAAKGCGCREHFQVGQGAEAPLERDLRHSRDLTRGQVISRSLDIRHVGYREEQKTYQPNQGPGNGQGQETAFSLRSTAPKFNTIL